MITARLAFSLLGYWHVGTGKGAGPTHDAVVIRTAGGLPFLPGKAIKGLLREATDTVLRAEGYAARSGLMTRLFGSGIDSSSPEEPVLEQPSDREKTLEATRFRTTPGSLIFSSAFLGATPEEAARWERWAAHHPGEREHLFREFSSTSLNEDGRAQDRTLRSIEVVVPMTLHATVHGPPEDWTPEPWTALLARALPLVDGVGAHRTRGLGRVQVTLEVVS